MVWKRSERDEDTPRPAGTPAPNPPATDRRSEVPARRSGGGGQAGNSLIGPSLEIDGEIKGEEDLTIEGSLEGRVDLPKNGVVVGKNGRLSADVHARSVRVQGTVTGDLYGTTEIVIEAGGTVQGNIQAPRVVLEDGCKFKGSIDMEPEKKDGGSRKSEPAGGKPGEGGSGKAAEGGGKPGEGGSGKAGGGGGADRPSGGGSPKGGSPSSG